MEQNREQEVDLGSISPTFYALIFHTKVHSKPNSKQRKNFCTKCAHKMLMKLTQGVNFTNILCAAFIHADPKCAKKSNDLTVFLSFWDLRT
jgi:hypothetical protein